MATYTDSQKARIMEYPIVEILKHFGKRTDHYSQMYFSPFRDEKNPSFHIKSDENVWMDFGSGKGGNVLTLVSLLGGIPLSECWDYVASLMDGGLGLCPDTVSNPLPLPSSTKSSRIVIDKIRDQFSSFALVRYAQTRGIPRHILERYCRQVTYHIGDDINRSSTAIGFPTSGGWVLRSRGEGPYSKRCTTSSCTFLGASGEPVDRLTCSRVEVFEGFFDFLSWLVLKDRTKPFSDVCVLNSVNNLSRGMEFICAHEEVSCWMDNDQAGMKALDTLMETVPKVKTHMKELGECKDVNDLLESAMKKNVIDQKIQNQSSITIKH